MRWPAPEPMRTRPLVFDILLAPQQVRSLGALQWDLLIRQSRRANLLAKLACELESAGMLDAVPAAVLPHLRAAQQIAARQKLSIHWEAVCIGKAMAELQAPVVLLKGAAYLLGELPMAQGRLFSDVDILVPKAFLDQAEAACLRAGWRAQEVSDYDQRYYRRWMHEIPPLYHERRGSSLDLHHAILPETARLKVNTAALFDQLQALPAYPGLFTLAPADMLLHSATHLFHEGEFEHGARDLFDLRGLMLDFGQRAGFWERLLARAATLGLQRPLFYALRYAHRLLDTPVPAEVLDASRAGAPPQALLPLMDACYARALLPLHASCDSAGAQLARQALYLRSHWLRMPPHLLAYHLAHKALWPSHEPAVEGEQPR